MELHTHDNTLLRSRVRHFQFLISEYELVKAKKHPRSEGQYQTLRSSADFVQLTSIRDTLANTPRTSCRRFCYWYIFFDFLQKNK